MYYVLFHYTKKAGRNWFSLSTEPEVIQFLHKSYEDVMVDEIIEVRAKHRLGLVVTEDYIKSELEPEKETESLVPIEKKPEEIVKENKEKLEELETEEPGAEEEVEEEELTPEERTKKALSEADLVIAREKLRQEQKKSGWELCTKCNSNRVAPWNKKQICTPCQNERKTDRPYSSRSKEFPGL